MSETDPGTAPAGDIVGRVTCPCGKTWMSFTALAPVSATVSAVCPSCGGKLCRYDETPPAQPGG